MPNSAERLRKIRNILRVNFLLLGKNNKYKQKPLFFKNEEQQYTVCSLHKEKNYNKLNRNKGGSKTNTESSLDFITVMIYMFTHGNKDNYS